MTLGQPWETWVGPRGPSRGKAGAKVLGRRSAAYLRGRTEAVAGQAVGYGPLREVREVGWAGPLRQGLEPELPGEPSQDWGTGHT